MKVTFIEEIEARKAWTNRMTCPKCNEFKYSIHRQFQPWPDEWWISCDNCGYETTPAPTRDIAIERWKRG